LNSTVLSTTKKNRDISSQSGERRESDDREGAQEITMVVQQDIL
jgi:hypothetical protein